jgi:hypothetical protein
MMTLRKKTLLIVGVTLIGLMTLLYITIQTVVLNSFVKLEQEQVYQNIEQVRAALLDQFTELNSIAGDWASWDDTYAYIKDHDKTYITSNMNGGVLTNLGLNLILFMDTSQQVVYSQAVQLESGAAVPVPQSLNDYLTQNEFILRHNSPTSSLTGVIALPEGPLLFASRPIVTSEFKGPIRGALIMGRFLDAGLMAHLTETTRLPIIAYPVDDPHMPADIALAQATLAKGNPVFVQPLNEEVIAGYFLLSDVYGKSIYILKMQTPRQIYRQGQAATSFFIFLLGVTGLIFGLMTLLLLEREVLSRLTHLNRSVSRIGQSGNLAERIKLAGQDELAGLAGEINQMLAALGQSEQALRESEQKFRHVISSVSDHIYVISLKSAGDSYFSPNIERITGYPQANFGDNWNFWESIIYPEDKAIFAKHTTNFWQGHNSEAEYRLIHAQDNLIWVRDSGRVEANPSGAPSVVYGIVSDITERKHAEVLLEEYKILLESQISTRTTELVTLNEQLLQEIAERVEKEQALRKSEEKFRTLTERIGAAIIIHKGADFLYVNSAAEAISGYSRDELLAMNFWTLVHPNFQALVQERAKGRLQRDGLPPTYEIKMVGKGGQEKWVNLRLGMIEYDGGPAIIGTIIDITERKHAEEALQTSHERVAAIASDNAKLFEQERHHRQVAEGLREIITTLNSSRDQDIVLAKILEQLRRLVKSDSAGIMLKNGENLLLVATTTDNQEDIGMPIPIASDDPAARVFKRKQPLIIADVHLDPGWEIWQGGEKIRAWMGVPLFVNEQSMGVLTLNSFEVGAFRGDDLQLLQIFADQAAIAITNANLYTSAQQEIAERTQAEELLKQARDQALAASQLKTELLAKVSHELRTPLGVILGFAEMLEAGIYGSLSGEQWEPTATIIESTHYLTGLVNELLDQAQLEAGRLKLNNSTFTPSDIIEDMHSKMTVLAQAKGITLSTQIGADVPATLRGDEARVKQILINLVSNAIKFTKEGSVQICLHCPDTNHWAMQVSDTGVGIPAEALAYIFEPFRQVDGSATREQTGTGLGLSIVKQLTQLMGGEVIVKSEIGQGSTFTVTLPFTPPQENHKSPDLSEL